MELDNSDGEVISSQGYGKGYLVNCCRDVQLYAKEEKGQYLVEARNLLLDNLQDKILEYMRMMLTWPITVVELFLHIRSINKRSSTWTK